MSKFYKNMIFFQGRPLDPSLGGGKPARSPKPAVFPPLETSLRVPNLPSTVRACYHLILGTAQGGPLRPPVVNRCFLVNVPSTGSGNVILSCQGISSQGGRVSSMQNCEAILQSQEKYTEEFFLGRHGLGMLRYVEQHGPKNPSVYNSFFSCHTISSHRGWGCSNANRHPELLRHICTHLLQMWIRDL